MASGGPDGPRERDRKARIFERVEVPIESCILFAWSAPVSRRD
jgi:hypothetical protein